MLCQHTHSCRYLSLVTFADTPRPLQNTPRRLPSSAPVKVVMYKITDDAGDVWDAYQGKGVPLYQVQTAQGARERRERCFFCNC